ncbi:MAG: hypothetical protein KGZ51_00465 [Erysipelothrix sp.]|jgi:hypothetical protein|nr:hypothetical protein [Erysipelothrix sp.]
MIYVTYALWIVALIIALRFAFSLYYQWKYKDIVKQNPQASRKLLYRYASPLGLVLLLSFALQNQPLNGPGIANINDFKMLPARQADMEIYSEYKENIVPTDEDTALEGYIIVEEEGVEVKYYVIKIRGESYLIKDPIDE